MQGPQVWSPVGELRYHMLHDVAKKKKKILQGQAINVNK